jgi:cation transport regulator
MPYESESELPEGVRHVLPHHAQEIYKEAYNAAWDEYADARERRRGASQEETAHRVAWAAVKKQYQKGEDERWHRKAA